MCKPLALVGLLLGSWLSAQSPLTTNFVGDNGGAVGGGVYFDLTVTPTAGIGIVALDVNLASPAGTVGSVQLWRRSGVSAGFEGAPAGWTLLGTASVVAAGRYLPTRCLFPAPVTVPAGLNGIALRAVGVAHAYTNGNGANQTYANAQLLLQAGTANQVAFAPGTVYSPRVVNCTIYYGSEVFAQSVDIGRGCNASAVSFYEEWAAGAFDLSNQGWRASSNANGGANVVASPLAFVAPTGTGLGLTDDSLSGPLSLGFTWSLAGVTTSKINVCSNGFIHLQGNATATDFSPSALRLLLAGPRLAALWCDLDPDGATNVANVFFETATGEARVTWLNVPHFNGLGASTVQVVFRDGATDTVDVIFRSAGHPAAPQISGFSPGANNRDPGSKDLSTAIPFSTRNDVAPLQQSADLPVIGTTANLRVSNIAPGSLSGVQMLGVGQAPIDLTVIGMPTCFLYLTPQVSLPFATTSSTAVTLLPIPNDVNLLASQITLQALTATPGANTQGLLTSNSTLITIGNL